MTPATGAADPLVRAAGRPPRGGLPALLVHQGHRPRRSPSSSTALALTPGERVLDVGCGPGRHARALAGHGVDVRRRRHLGRGSSTVAAEDGARAAVRAGRRPGPADRRRRRSTPRSRSAKGASASGGPAAAGLATGVEPDEVVLAEHGPGAPTGRAPGAHRLLRLLPGALPRGRGRLRRRDAASTTSTPRCTTRRRRGRASSSGRPASRPGSCACSLDRCGFSEAGTLVGHARRATAGTTPTVDSPEFLARRPDSAGSLSSPFRRAVRFSPAGSHCPAPTKVPSPCPTTSPPRRPLSPSPAAADAAPSAPSTRRAVYNPRQIVDDDLGGRSRRRLSRPPWSRSRTASSSSGTVVKVDQDEVLLDIGYKSEGVIPSRELSIRNDVDPSEIVSLGDEHRGPRPQEGGQGRPPDPVQEAGPVRAGLGQRSRRSRKRTASSPARSSRSSRAA